MFCFNGGLIDWYASELAPPNPQLRQLGQGRTSNELEHLVQQRAGLEEKSREPMVQRLLRVKMFLVSPSPELPCQTFLQAERAK